MELIMEQFPIVIQSLNVGFLQTLKLFFVTLLGALPLGLIIAFGSMSHFRPLKYITNIIVWVVRGTPLMIQMLIIYYFPGLVLNNVVWGGGESGRFVAASVAFIFNYACYFSVIYRGGIQSVPQGQTEAGRSLGLNFTQTMRLIIIPQAFKNVLPALVNEFIVLIKETSIIGYIGMMDLTKGAMLIQSRTYNAFMPLLAAAAIYLIVVMVLTFFMNKLERRLRTSER